MHVGVCAFSSSLYAASSCFNSTDILSLGGSGDIRNKTMSNFFGF